MGAVSGLGTTYNLPNYHGELLEISPQDTPFTTAIGGLNGGAGTTDTEFEWQTVDLRAAATNRQRLEGADAPTADERTRSQVKNVVEIHQEKVEVSYTKQAAIGRYSGLATDGSAPNPVRNEFQQQIDWALKAKKRDIESTFINGTYQLPVDNTTVRQTRGLIPAITTNVTAAAAAALTKKMILDMMQQSYDNGGIMEEETRILMVPPVQKRNITTLFITNSNYQQLSSNVGGVACTVIETDFGKVNVMTNRYVPSATVVLVDASECQPVFLEVPGKGVLFVEPLAKTGAQEKAQLYGEIGLKYGNELHHGKITGLSTAVI
jgi:hypothetical protein